MLSHGPATANLWRQKRVDTFEILNDRGDIKDLTVCSLRTVMEQMQYDHILAYLRTGNLPTFEIKKDSLRRRSRSFVAKDGMLFYRN